MPVMIKLKTKKPRFNGDSPSWWIVATGPRELFSPQLEKRLFLHGLRELGTGEIRNWSTPPAIGAPPLYLARMLADDFNCRPDRDTREMLERAVRAVVAEDGFEQFIGQSKATPAGERPLRIAAGSRDFIANCAEIHWDRRALLEGAGWLPVMNPSAAMIASFGTRPYRTRDPFMASNLAAWMTEDANTRRKQLLAKAKAHMRRSETQAAPEDFAIPSPEGLDYLDFQKTGISIGLEAGTGALIADDMGLGKTIQAIGILNGRPEIKRMIVFCQANMRLKWVREIEKWKINEELSVAHAEGSSFPDSDIVVINYDIVARHIEQIRSIGWDLAVADEAHSLKDPTSKRSQAILGDLDSGGDKGSIPLAKGGQMILLTGTPKPNRVSELWPLLSATRPDLWGRGPEARQAFLNRYEPPVLIQKQLPSKYRNGPGRTIIVPIPGKPVRELELQMRLRGSGAFARRMKRDTDLPPKFRTPIEMPFRLTKEDQEILKQAEADLTEIGQRIKSAAVTAGQMGLAKEVIDVISGLSPKSPHFSEIARVRRNLGILKAPHAAKFILDEIKDDKDLLKEQRRKTVVFAHHKEVIRIIAEAARKEIPNGVLVYDGSVTGSAAKRQARVDAFQEDPDQHLFIMSLAGATGITLTASHRMRVVEPDWSPSNMVQIEDRIWRIGQEQHCDIGYLFAPNSLDCRIGTALFEKMEIDERAINTMSFQGMRAHERRRPAMDAQPQRQAAKPQSAEPQLQFPDL